MALWFHNLCIKLKTAKTHHFKLLRHSLWRRLTAAAADAAAAAAVTALSLLPRQRELSIETFDLVVQRLVSRRRRAAAALSLTLCLPALLPLLPCGKKPAPYEMELRAVWKLEQSTNIVENSDPQNRSETVGEASRDSLGASLMLSEQLWDLD